MNNKIRRMLFLLLIVIWGYAGAAPRWIEHASQPGLDNTGLGQSRFDQLFLVGHNRYRIPYPFSSLIEFLELRIDNGDLNGVRQVPVPIGRSLQRDAPAPKHFSFPRIVIALEGEPVTDAANAGQVLEYRLFIAHQPSTETLEIISYNDSAARFEFQVVSNYTADKTPQVEVANRAMCLSCHQNAAPIFASRPWSETSFNVEIANKLIATLPQQYNSLIGVVTGDAGVIDVLAERANYLAAAQLIWQQGCSSRTCRATMLRAILQYRLSGEANFDASDKRYWQDYYGELTRNWHRQWPSGLALANSRIIDRDPFAAVAMTFEHDPLFPRPAHATWYAPDQVLASGIVYRLAGFFTLADIQRIDRHLRLLGDTKPALTRSHDAHCTLSPNDTSSYVLICGDKTTSAGLQAEFEIEFAQTEPASIRIVDLHAPHDANLLQPDIVQLSQFQGGIDMVPGNRATSLSLRLANGDRIRSLKLRWKNLLLSGEAMLSMEIAAEFQTLEQALAEIQHNQQPGDGDSLASKVFKRQTIMRELMLALGMQSLRWPSIARSSPAVAEATTSELSGDLALLEPYCAHCHAGETVHPPGFLSGEQPLAKIKQCAPRILARLQAWQTGASFPASPMPPPASLEISGMTSTDWPHSEHYHRLVASIEKLARADSAGVVYQRLPSCLAAVSE